MYFFWWNSFRDEMVGTAVILTLTTVASFYVGYRLVVPPSARITVDQQRLEEILASKVASENTPQVLGATQNTPSSPKPSPTPDPFLAEVAYGEPGVLDFPEYQLEFIKPRLEFDSRTNTRRRFIVDMVLKNKTVQPSLGNRITAKVVKDGAVIVEEAALSLSETKAVKPGEQLTFRASLALIESTDVNLIMFKPPGASTATYQLYAAGGP